MLIKQSHRLGMLERETHQINLSCIKALYVYGFMPGTLENGERKRQKGGKKKGTLDRREKILAAKSVGGDPRQGREEGRAGEQRGDG